MDKRASFIQQAVWLYFLFALSYRDVEIFNTLARPPTHFSGVGLEPGGSPNDVAAMTTAKQPPNVAVVASICSLCRISRLLWPLMQPDISVGTETTG